MSRKELETKNTVPNKMNETEIRQQRLRIKKE